MADEERIEEQTDDPVVLTREVHFQGAIGGVQVKTSGGSPHIECKLILPWDKIMAGELGDLQVSAKAPINFGLVYEEPQMELPVDGYENQDEELDFDEQAPNAESGDNDFEDNPEPGFQDPESE